MGDHTHVLLAGGMALTAALLLTPAVRSFARRVGMVARPRADRYHRKPTALLGGLALFGGFALAIGVTCAIRGSATAGAGEVSAAAATGLMPIPKLLLALGCAAAMFGLGLLDDLFTFRPIAKLLGQLVIAGLFVSGGVRLVYSFVPAVDMGITMLWLVGITNALNLLDNLDGLAAGVTAIAAAFLTYFFLSAGLPVEAGITAALAGACLGFLVFNWSPASIFMGDSGSLFLGFLLGAVTLFNQSHRTRNLLATLAVPVLVLLVPILDTALVTFARRAHGRAVSQGGTDHISHRLVALGLTDRATVLVIYLVALASGAVALVVRDLAMPVAIALVVLFVAALVTGIAVVVRVQVYGSRNAAGPDGPGPVAPGRTGEHLAAPSREGDAEGVAQETTGGHKGSAGWFIHLLARPWLMLFLYDLVAVVFCYYLAFLLRFGNNPLPFLETFVTSLPLVVGTQLALLVAMGIYRTHWPRASAADAVRLGLSVALAVAGAVAVTTLIFRFEGLSRAVFAIDAVLLLMALGVGRLAGRATWMLSQEQYKRHHVRTILVGAGAAGDAAARELEESLRWGLRPVGFVDDDPAKRGLRVKGLPVLGTLAELEAVARQARAKTVLICISSPPQGLAEALERRCGQAGLALKRFRLEIEEVGKGT